MSANQQLVSTDTWELQSETVFYDGREQTVEFAIRPPKIWNTQADIIGIPKHYQDCDLSKFDFDIYSIDTGNLRKLCHDFITNFTDWLIRNTGLYIWSATPGTGKTFLACCILQSLLVKHDLRSRFITDSDYINLVGEGYKRNIGAEDSSEIYRSCDLLILDDLGSCKSGDWQKQELFRLINHRLDNRLMTIYTSNLAPENQNLDDRIIDRVITGSAVIKLPEEPIRRRKAQAKQRAFINKILSR